MSPIVLLALPIGVLLGALGGGGAILTVPVLTYLLDQPPSAATTGSLIVVGLSSLVGLVPHHRAGRVRWRDGLTFGLLGIVGALVGSKLSAAIPSTVLMVLFAGLLLVVAALMARRAWGPRQDGAADTESDSSGWWLRIAAATGVGLLTGFFGVGGGFVIVPALTLVVGLPMRQAAATSLLVIAINSASSLTGRALDGNLDVDGSLILPFAGLTVVGTLLGARLGERVDQRRLKQAFTILLLLVATFVAVLNVPKLFP